MVTQELTEVVTREWMREATRLQLERQARAPDGQSASPRRATSALRIWRLSLPSFLACLFRSTPTS